MPEADKMKLLTRNSGLKSTAVFLAVFASFALSQAQRPMEEKGNNLSREYLQSLEAGESRWREGDFQEAFSLLDSARDLAHKMNDAEKETSCLLLLGRLCWALGRIEDSPKFYSAALLKAEAAGLKEALEESRVALKIGELYSQGKAERFARRYEKSIAAITSALEWSRKLESREHEVKCLRQLSLTRQEMLDFEGFFTLNERGLELARELHDQREQAKFLINLGFYYFRLKEYTKALDYYSEALELSKNIENMQDEAFCLKNISLILMHLGFYESSLDHLLAAQAIDEQSGNIFFQAQNMNNLGEAFRTKGEIFSSQADLYQAVEYFMKALDLARMNGDKNTQLVSLNNIGNIHLDFDNFHAALNYYQSGSQIAAELRDSEVIVEIMNNIGICHLELGNYEKAESCFIKALKLTGQASAPKIHWKVLFSLGQCYEKMGAVDQALACYRDSLKAVDYIRSQILVEDYRVGFGREKFKVYEALIFLLYRLHKNDLSPNRAKEIFEIVERAKARSFIESLGELKNDLYPRMNPEIGKKERELSNQISTLILHMAQRELPRKIKKEYQEKLQHSEAEYLRLLARIKIEAPEVAEAVSLLPVRVEHVQDSLLDERTAIFEYFLGESQSYLFSITKKEFILLPLPPKKDVERSLSAYINLLSRPPGGKWTGFPAARRLAQELLLPALEGLPASVDRLIIIPDGSLYSLPFETLALHSERQTSGEDFLISRYAVSYAPSCSSLLFLQGRQKKEDQPKRFLGFGNPAYPVNIIAKRRNRVSVAEIMKDIYEKQGFRLSPLRQSQKEIKEISRHFSKGKRDLYLGEKANETMMKKISLADYQIIHLACHSFVDENVPFRSSLFLSFQENESEDGFLQAREIADLKLNAELVVLSACQTSKGYVEKGEGIMGMTRIFFYSGARSVVSTLWEISDQASFEFMRHFYDCLWEGKDKSQALRLAKLRLLGSKYSHPFYWAAFVLQGEPFSRLIFD